jgi:hypothetical protein
MTLYWFEATTTSSTQIESTWQPGVFPKKSQNIKLSVEQDVELTEFHPSPAE